MKFFILLLLLFFIPIIHTFKHLSCLKCNKGFEQATEDFFKYLKKAYWYQKGQNEILEGVFTLAYTEIMSKYDDSRNLDHIGMTDLYETYRKLLISLEAPTESGTELERLMQIQFQELKTKVDSIFTSYENERACPNLKNDSNCGVMEQKIVNCDTCQQQTLLCVGGTNENKCEEMVVKCPMCVCHEGSCYDKNTKKNCDACPGYMKCLNEVLHCSTQQIEIHEDETLGFKCYFKFIPSIEEEIEYVYDKRVNFRIQPLKVDSEPYFVKPFATSQDSGHYTCTIRSKESKFPFAKADFIVKVEESGSRSMHLPHPNVEVLPAVLSGDIEDGEDDHIATMALFICAPLAIIIAVIFAIIFIHIYRRKRLEDIKEIALHMAEIKKTQTIVHIMTSLMEQGVDQSTLSSTDSSGK